MRRQADADQVTDLEENASVFYSTVPKYWYIHEINYRTQFQMLRVEQITLIQMGLKLLTKERGEKMLLPDSTIGSFLIKVLPVLRTKKKYQRETSSKENWRIEGNASCCPPETIPLFYFNFRHLSFARSLTAHI